MLVRYQRVAAGGRTRLHAGTLQRRQHHWPERTPRQVLVLVLVLMLMLMLVLVLVVLVLVLVLVPLLVVKMLLEGSMPRWQQSGAG